MTALIHIHSTECRDCNADYNINHSHAIYTYHFPVLFLTIANAPRVCRQPNRKPLVLSELHIYIYIYICMYIYILCTNKQNLTIVCEFACHGVVQCKEMCAGTE